MKEFPPHIQPRLGLDAFKSLGDIGRKLPGHIVGNVHVKCIDLWKKGLAEGRRGDGFIGITDCRDLTLYLAPCFGFFPGKSEVVSRNVRPSTDRIDQATLDAVYGKENVLYIPLSKTGSFDGHSHKKMVDWANLKFSIKAHYMLDIMGWSIQCSMGQYYIRFASGRNKDRFVKKSEEGMAKKPKSGRDMPKAWARWTAEVLRKDLTLTLAKEWDTTTTSGDGLTKTVNIDGVS